MSYVSLRQSETGLPIRARPMTSSGEPAWFSACEPYGEDLQAVIQYLEDTPDTHSNP